jgi:TRAP-type C4-dicarboxylate transport system substrate-binding protein
LPKNAVLVNRKAFDALDKPTQDAVLKAAADAEKRGWAVSAEKNDWYKQALAEKGMKIMPSPPKLTADFRQLGGVMLEDWLKKAGPEGKVIVDGYRK